MKKFIFVLNALELMSKLYTGKRVKGVLYIDDETGRLTFKAYNCTQIIHNSDLTVHKLEHGWVKESKERIKLFESLPKELGTARVLAIIDRETKEAKEALIDRELDLLEFC